MIKSLHIKNFKSIEEINLELRPLTIFTGQNASGKSNILEAIAILSQTAKLPGDERRYIQNSLRNGEYYKYNPPYFDQIMHKKAMNKHLSFEIHFKPSPELLKDIFRQFVKFESYRNQIFGIIQDDPSLLQAINKISIGYNYTHRPDDQEEIIQQVLINKNIILEITKKKKESSSTSLFTNPPLFQKSKLLPAADVAELLTPDNFRQAGTSNPPEEVDEYFNLSSYVAQELIKFIKKELEKIYILSPIRGRILREEKIIPENYSWVGKEGEYLMYILSKVNRLQDAQKRDKIKTWSAKFGLSGINATYGGEGKLVSEFIDSEFNVIINTAYASHGSRQILTIITQLFWSNRGDVIMIEEPEISLHPKAQVLLHELFAEVIADGKQIICTTHSPFLILALSKIIKNKTLSKDDIAVYHVEKDKRGTKAKLLEFNDRGYIPGWIDSYAQVEDDLFNEWSEGLGED